MSEHIAVWEGEKLTKKRATHLKMFKNALPFNIGAIFLYLIAIYYLNLAPRVPMLCDRKYGIGADGLILISNHNSFSFEMKFFNPCQRI
ncbi:hypothetical protein N9K77_02115 [bacterium]|nr:hypothetical protein [bacterium]